MKSKLYRKGGTRGKRGHEAPPTRPLPEALAPEVQWDIKLLPVTNDKGSCSKIQGSFIVPWHDEKGKAIDEEQSKAANCIRLHEYLHLKFSPFGPKTHPLVQELEAKLTQGEGRNERLFDAIMEWVAALEDLRINEIASMSGNEQISDLIRNHYNTETSAKKAAEKFRTKLKEVGHQVELVQKLSRLYACSQHTGAESQGRHLKCLIEEVLSDETLNLLNSTIAKVKNVRTFKSVVEGAIVMAMEFLNKVSEVSEIRGGPGGADKKLPSNESARLQYGKMKIEYPPRPIQQKKPRIYIRKDIGLSIASPERILTDGLAFREKVHRGEALGTVLIDMSGSMSLNESDILTLLQADPDITIAGYSGTPYNGGHGTLRILAKDRSCVAKIGQGLGGNVIDGPALEWLATQRPPLYWISDGQVTNCSEQLNDTLQQQAYTFCQEQKITRCHTITDFYQLRGLTKGS